MRVRTWTPERLAIAIRATLGLSITGQTIRNAIRRGDLAARRTTGGHWRIPDAVVRELWPGLDARLSVAA